MKRVLRLFLLVVLFAKPAAAQEPAPASPVDPAATADYYVSDPVLGEYIAIALDANPAIQQALARVQAAEQRVPEVTGLPDPTVNISQAIRPIETRVGPQWNTLTVSQRFPWFGKLGLRGQLADRDAEALQALHAAQQRDVIAAVKRTYYDLSYIDTAIVISREERALLDHYEQLAQSRYSTGQGLQQAVIKIQAEITKVISRLETLEQQRVTAAARLNALMDRPPQAGVAPATPPVLPDVTLDLADLYQLGERHRPELRASRTLIERGDDAIALAKREFWPDVTIGVSYVNVRGRDVSMPPPDNGKDGLAFSVGLNIPLWRAKYHAGVGRATEERLVQENAYEAVENEIQFAVRDQTTRLETHREQVRLFTNVLIPQAEEALRSSESAYQTGQLGVLELLDSERTLLQVRLSNLRHAADFLIALAELEHAIGTRFPN